jgi:hypothetical protein
MCSKEGALIVLQAIRGDNELIDHIEREVIENDNT